MGSTSGHSELSPSDVDFDALIPETLSKETIFSVDGYRVWGADMIRTDDGICHLLFSYWPEELGHESWLTHSMIGHATADSPTGPYEHQSTVLERRGESFWDGHTAHNPSVITDDGQFYLYYTGTRGPEGWDPDRVVSDTEERQAFRTNFAVGVAVADHPSGPWKRFDEPLLDTPEYGTDIAATPCAMVTPDEKIHLYYKTQEPGDGRFGGGVFHYPAVADDPLGPFEQYQTPLVDKRPEFPDETFQFHIDDHEEWYQDDRYYAIVKDHDEPYRTEHGQSLYLLESPDGLEWHQSRNTLVKDQTIQWDTGDVTEYRRLEMPKVHLENGRPAVLFLAGLESGDDPPPSYNVVVPLGT